jgi:hypothetical protein
MSQDALNALSKRAQSESTNRTPWLCNRKPKLLAESLSYTRTVNCSESSKKKQGSVTLPSGTLLVGPQTGIHKKVTAPPVGFLALIPDDDEERATGKMGHSDSLHYRKCSDEPQHPTLGVRPSVLPLLRSPCWQTCCRSRRQASADGYPTECCSRLKAAVIPSECRKLITLRVLIRPDSK